MTDRFKATLSVSRVQFLTLVFEYTDFTTKTGKSLYRVTYYRNPIVSRVSLGRRGVLEHYIKYNTKTGYIGLLIKGFEEYAKQFPYDTVPFVDESIEFNTDLLMVVINPANVIAARKTPTITNGGKRRYEICVSRKPLLDQDPIPITVEQSLLIDETANYPLIISKMLNRYQKEFKYDLLLTY